MKKLTALLLAGLLLLAPALTSCNNATTVDPVTGETITKPDVVTDSGNDSQTGDETEAETEEIVTRTTHLTGIFEMEKLPNADKNVSYRRDYPVTFDEDGNFRIFTRTGSGDDRVHALVTVNPDGEILEKNRIHIRHQFQY